MIETLKNKLIQDKHFSELLKGSSIAFILKIIGVGLGYIFTLLIARWYGADIIGIYALSLTLLNIFAIIGVFGFDNALIKFVAEYNSHNKFHLIKEVYHKVLTISIPLSFLLSLILFFNANFFAKIIFKNEEMMVFFQVVSFGIIPLVVLKINGAMFRGLKEIKEFSFFDSILIFLLATIFLTFFYFFNFTNKMVVGSQIIAIILTTLVSFLVLHKKIHMLHIQNLNILKYKDILKTSLPMALSSSIALLMGWVDIIMLGMFTTQEVVGLYFIILKISAISSIVLISMNTIVAPKIAECFSQKDTVNLKRISLYSVKMIFYITFPLNIIIFLFPEIILNCFGEQFVEASYALSILMLAQLVNSLAGANGSFLYMTGKQVVDQNINLILIVLNILLNYLLIPIYGLLGAVFATSSVMILKNIFLFIYIKKNFGFYMIYIPKIIKK